MKDRECVALLREVFPRMGLRWEGFPRVRGIVRKRLGRRLRALGLADAVAYRAYIESHEDEWAVLAEMCRIPITRFYRDREVFDRITRDVLPALARDASARGDACVRVWSAGCAAGEEPYSLAIAWRLGDAVARAGVELRVVATDAEPESIERAARGCYPWGSLKELPAAWRERAFEPRDGGACVREEFRAGIAFEVQDLRREQPEGVFDLVLCRNLAFTYFDAGAQREALARIAERTREGGVLVIGHKESLPPGATGFPALDARLRLFTRRGDGDGTHPRVA